MKPVKFDNKAKEEMLEAAHYYDSKQKGLGKRFLSSINQATKSIQIFPELYPIVEAECRRCLVEKFPFGVIYNITPDYIIIIAVMHLYRDPDYWKDRQE